MFLAFILLPAWEKTLQTDLWCCVSAAPGKAPFHLPGNGNSWEAVSNLKLRHNRGGRSRERDAYFEWQGNSQLVVPPVIFHDWGVPLMHSGLSTKSLIDRIICWWLTKRRNTNKQQDRISGAQRWNKRSRSDAGTCFVWNMSMTKSSNFPSTATTPC